MIFYFHSGAEEEKSCDVDDEKVYLPVCIHSQPASLSLYLTMCPGARKRAAVT